MPKDETNVIPQVRRVIYDLYANFPTSGLHVQDLAYATDRGVLYRWNGASWDAISISSETGLAAAIPAVADRPIGALYYETDTTILKQNSGAAWVSLTTAGHVYPRYETRGGNDALTAGEVVRETITPTAGYHFIVLGAYASNSATVGTVTIRIRVTFADDTTLQLCMAGRGLTDDKSNTITCRSAFGEGIGKLIKEITFTEDCSVEADGANVWQIALLEVPSV